MVLPVPLFFAVLGAVGQVSMSQAAEGIPAEDAAVRRGSRLHQTFSAFQYRNFRLLWISTLFVSGGNWVQQVTLGWLAFELSSSALQVSLVVGLRAVPLLMAPLSGAIADRFDRRQVMLIDQAFLAVLALGFAAIVLSDNHVLWHLHLFSFLTGVGWSINNPVRQVLVSNSVPRQALMNAVALNSMAFNFTRVFGPAVGGLLITFFGPGLNFLIQGIFYVCVMVMILPFRAEYTSDHSAIRRRSIFSNVREGFRYVVGDKNTLTVILVALVPTLTMMSFIMTLMPVYAVEVLGQKPGEGSTLGLLLTGAGIGGFVGTFLMAIFSQIRNKGRLVIISLFMAGLGIIGFAQVSVLWQAMAILVFVNAFQMAVMTTNNTMLQMMTPDEMRGRVMGVYMMDIGMMPLGGLVGGLIAEAWGVQTALVSGAVVGVTAVTLIALLNPRFRSLRL
jgi:MFS family permease